MRLLFVSLFAGNLDPPAGVRASHLAHVARSNWLVWGVMLGATLVLELLLKWPWRSFFEFSEVSVNDLALACLMAPRLSFASMC